MYLRRLVLENVRSIKYLDLPFSTEDDETRKWTFVLGENGTGKSTVLRSIALLLAGTEALPELLVNTDSWIRNRTQSCRLFATLVTAQGKERDIEISMRRGDGIKDVFKRNRELLDLLDQAISHTERNYFTVGYGASRRFSSDRYSTSRAAEIFRDPRAQRVATMFVPDATLNPLDSWAMDLDYRRKDGIKIVRNALDDLLPNVKFKGIDKDRRKLLFRTPDGSVSLDQLSEGYQNVALWCGDLLYRITETFEDYKKPLEARGLLLIDELSLHLHPVWQRQLIGFLTDKLPNFQIIATTHSPLTVHQADEGELFMLRREEPGKPPVLQAYPGSPRTLMLHQLLLSPVFGLTTMHSHQMEALRSEYKALQDKQGRSADENARLDTLRRDLADLPDWTAETPRERKQRTVLEEIRQALKDRDISRGSEGRGDGQ